MRKLAEFQPFLNVLAASEDQIEKQRPMEYVSRFLVYSYVPYDGKLDVQEFIDEGIIGLAQKGETKKADTTFQSTFKLLDDTFGGNALRRLIDGQPSGRVTLAAFECLAVGIAINIDSILDKENPGTFVKQRIEAFWNANELDQFFSPGLRGTYRIQRTIPFGAEWFAA